MVSLALLPLDSLVDVLPDQHPNLSIVLGKLVLSSLLLSVDTSECMHSAGRFQRDVKHACHPISNDLIVPNQIIKGLCLEKRCEGLVSFMHESLSMSTVLI